MTAVATNNQVHPKQHGVFMEFFETPTIELLQQIRRVVESRGVPAEYRALADEFEALNCLAAAGSLRRKADGMEAGRAS